MKNKAFEVPLVPKSSLFVRVFVNKCYYVVQNKAVFCC